MSKTQKPYGLWHSPISPRMLAASVRLNELDWSDDGETLVWLEARGGRSTLMTQTLRAHGTDAPRELTETRDVRARMGYGGGDFSVGGSSVFFADARSGRIFRQELRGGSARGLTPAFGTAAAPQLTRDGRYVVYVHQDEAHVDRIAIVDADGKGWPQILVQGADFYAYPRVSPDGLLLAYVAWNHPDMPWDGAAVHLAPLEYGRDGLPHAGTAKRIAGIGTADAGVSKATAAFQPQFTPDGAKLLYVSDESGWLHLHAYDLRSGTTQIYPVGDGAEHATPAWVQEIRTFAVTPDSRSVFLAANQRGFTRLYKVDLQSGEAELIEALSSYTDAAQLTVAPKSGKLAFIGSAPAISPRIVVYDNQDGSVRVVARSTGESLAEADLAKPVPITFRSVPGEEAHGLFYAPQNRKFESSGMPPLIVIVHGGPTGQARATYSPQAQFFTSRGYAVLFVNHRGSTGYGRAFMQKLRGAWGVVDVEDAVAGARHLADQGKVDGKRMVIMGGSAGGYTTLQAMVTHPDAFAAGISMYGISNLFKLDETTHKFEERYNDSMLGPLPEASEIWRKRSPIYFADRINRPLAIFQGTEDKVVLKEQSDLIVAALAKHGVPHVYHLYEGEGHGFRKPETIQHFYDQVDSFLREFVVYN